MLVLALKFADSQFPTLQLMDIFHKCHTTQGYFGPYRAQDDHYFTRPILDPIPGRETTFQGKKCVQWSINNYLGLAESEEIREVAIEAAQKFSTSAPMGSRMMTGNTERHIELEKRLADYIAKESAILFNYGYLGVLGTLSSLVDTDDTIILDKMSHSCLVEGTRMSSGSFRVFRHNDMDSLEKHLRRINRDRKGGVLIVTEGVFGMQGDIANLPAICELKEKYDARLFVDDAHGFGVMGETGQGSGEFYGVQDKIDIYFGTFAKAFASIGGVAGGSKSVVDWIRYNARTQVFAKSLPMIYVETLLASLERIRNDHWRREKMWRISRLLKKGLRNLGYEVGEVPSPLTPVYVPAGDERVAQRLITGLRDLGIFVTGVMYPVVPHGIILFRLVPTASHTEEDVERTLDAFRHVRDHLRLKVDAA